uniref:Uncharacterized protein n=1 Tax=Timema genevievae TaxID=629358 RepID=A0A7R9PKX7_TIMGE|nr:unnamed protein product [Timema genevievae]
MEEIGKSDHSHIKADTNNMEIKSKSCGQKVAGRRKRLGGCHGACGHKVGDSWSKASLLQLIRLPMARRSGFESRSDILKVKEEFGNQINLCRDRGLNPGPPAQKSDTLPLDRQFQKSLNSDHLEWIQFTPLIVCLPTALWVIFTAWPVTFSYK